LTDTDIETLLITREDEWIGDVKTKKLLIKDFEKESLTPVGYDLRVGEQYLKMSRKVKDWNKLQDDSDLVILPDEMVAIETKEFIGMPQNKEYSGILVSRVTIAEKGLSHISTSLDPDYKGTFIITLSNESRRKVTLRKNQPFCTMILFRNKSPATRECGKSSHEHLLRLLADWKVVGKQLRKKTICFWILKISIPTIILVSALYVNYLIRPVSEAEAALVVALGSLVFIILDKILRTE